MRTLATRLTVGEKVGLGFGLVGLILLAVIGRYDLTLRQVLDDYGRLDAVYGARHLRAFEIERMLTDARTAEERFLLTRDLALAELVRDQVEGLHREIDRLAAIDDESRAAADALRVQAQRFLDRFEAIRAAWQIKGLNEDVGLQGAFREAVHQLQDLAGRYEVERPYLLLLQIRRREKDLGLRRDPVYQGVVHRLLDELSTTIAASHLAGDVKTELSKEISIYRDALDAYAGIVLSDQDIAGGKGPFRDAAHRMEAILEAHYIPEMETSLLELRRREKDYLLRGDPAYVDMVEGIAAAIRGQIGASAVAEGEKAGLQGLLDAYERDFHALVAQDRRIADLTVEMDEAVVGITGVVKDNLERATAQLAEMRARIASTSAGQARSSLIIAASASVLGAGLAAFITLRIVRPVRQMAGTLQRMTLENPIERIEADPQGRDEINRMAISLNTMADHRDTFLKWWRASMREAAALRDLSAQTADVERFEAAEELRTAALGKIQQLNSIRGKMRRGADQVCAIGERIYAHPSATRTEDGAELRSTGARMRELLSLVEES